MGKKILEYVSNLDDRTITLHKKLQPGSQVAKTFRSARFPPPHTLKKSSPCILMLAQIGFLYYHPINGSMWTQQTGNIFSLPD